MRQGILAVVGVCAVFGLTGCDSTAHQVSQVHPDGSTTVVIRVTTGGLLRAVPLDNQTEQAKQLGWAVQRWTGEDGRAVVEVRRDFKDAEALTTGWRELQGQWPEPLASQIPNPPQLRIDHSLLTSSYTYELSCSPRPAAPTSQALGSVFDWGVKQLTGAAADVVVGSTVPLECAVELPGDIKHANSDRTDGHRVSWVITPERKTSGVVLTATSQYLHVERVALAGLLPLGLLIAATRRRRGRRP
jgi:hypothetical protein